MINTKSIIFVTAILFQQNVIASKWFPQIDTDPMTDKKSQTLMLNSEKNKGYLTISCMSGDFFMVGVQPKKFITFRKDIDITHRFDKNKARRNSWNNLKNYFFVPYGHEKTFIKKISKYNTLLIEIEQKLFTFDLAGFQKESKIFNGHCSMDEI